MTVCDCAGALYQQGGGEVVACWLAIAGVKMGVSCVKLGVSCVSKLFA